MTKIWSSSISLLFHSCLTWAPLSSNVQMITLTHFQPTFHFYTPWKTSENWRFSDVFKGYRSGTLVKNRLTNEMESIKFCRMLRKNGIFAITNIGLLTLMYIQILVFVKFFLSKANSTIWFNYKPNEETKYIFLDRYFMLHR